MQEPASKTSLLASYSLRRSAWLFRVRVSPHVLGFKRSFLIPIYLIVTDDILDVTSTSAELGKTVGKDVNTNKATYVKLLGLEKSKAEAQRIINEAKASIAVFGDRAVPLMAIADYIVNRKN